MGLVGVIIVTLEGHDGLFWSPPLYYPLLPPFQHFIFFVFFFSTLFPSSLFIPFRFPVVALNTFSCYITGFALVLISATKKCCT